MALAASSMGAGSQISGAHTKNNIDNTVKTASALKESNKVNEASSEQKYVIVADGDTLDGIATQNDTTYVRLFDANTDIQDPDVIYPGEKIRVPDADEQLPDRALPEDAAPVTTAPTVQTQPSAVASQPAARTYTAPVVQAAPVAGCGDNSYANFIYSHESGCRTTAVSPNGCYGIGQACPASKLAYCGADYACQNAFFTAYAGKYGGWAGAYAFWVAHGWW
jgi:LysM repeat protein